MTSLLIDHCLAKAGNGVLGLESSDLALWAVGLGIALEMAVVAVGLDLDQGWPVSRTCPGYRFTRDLEQL